MKVAVCMSGQPRLLDECYDYIKKNIIEPNEADVFMHGWYDEESLDEPYKFGGDGEWKNKRLQRDADVKAVQMYSPKAYRFQKQIQFKNSGIDFIPSIMKYQAGCKEECEEAGEDFEVYCKRILRNNTSMWYSIMQANLVKEEYAWENDVQYDFVIRCRFDVWAHHPIRCADLDPTLVYCQHLGQPANHVNDWIGIGNNTNMNIYSSVFTSLPWHIKWFQENNNNEWCNETALHNQLALHGIGMGRGDWGIGLPRF